MINATSLSFFAASCASLSNLCFRRSASAAASVNIYLLFYYLISFLWSLAIGADLLTNCWSPAVFVRGEMVYGSLSGIANASSTYLLLMATKWALPIEKGLIFPLFAVSVIVLCNFWGYKLYQERLDVRTIVLFSLGILIASIAL